VNGIDEQLATLTERLAALEGRPIAEHPAVLESVHAALVAELDRLAGKPPTDRAEP
jgi:hypothetical protein